MIAPHGGFILVHVNTSVEECEKRDRRALQENRRQIAEAEARLRTREEREAAEARKANQVAVGR